MKQPTQLQNVKKRSKDELEAEITKNTLACDGYQQRWLGGVPPRYRLEASRIICGKIVGAKRLIKMKCLDCCGFEDVQERIKNCHVKVCPLWTMRPFQNKK